MRSFLSAESAQPFPATEAELFSAEFFFELQQYLAVMTKGLRNNAMVALEVVETKLRELFVREFEVWSSERYFTKKNTAEFISDLIPFFDEYAALMPVVTYKYGPNGIQEGYTESMSDIAYNFIGKLEALGLATERAVLEWRVAQTVENWMANDELEVGDMLVGASPRGLRSELYPGKHKKNYIFWNIFVKTVDGFELRQYRSYDPNKLLPQLQNQLLDLHGTEVFATQTPKKADHQTINRLVTLSNIVTEHIEQIIYQHKQKWSVDIDKDLPKLDAVEYHAQVQQMTDLCVQELRTLMAAESDSHLASLQLDELIATVKIALHKWVETHALNYQSDEEDYELNAEELKEVWQTKLAKEDGQKLDEGQRSLLKNFTSMTKLNPHLPLRGLLSWGHCITGTPFSMSAQILKLQNVQLKSLAGVQMSGAELSMSLSSEEKAALANELAELIQVSVHGEIWYVPADYLDEPGCYWDESLQSVVGPCGIPLAQDTLAMNEATYNYLMSQLVEQDLAQDSDLDVTQKHSAISLYRLIESRLFRSSIGIDNWINDNVLASQKESLGPELKKLHQQLTSSLNPLLFLHGIVKKLIMNNETSLIEKITGECSPAAA